MKFKVGDVIEHIRASGELKVIKIAEGGERVDGPWSSREDYKDMPGESYILEVMSGIQEGRWRYTLVKEVDFYELVEKEKFKFKVGDVIENRWNEGKCKVVRTPGCGGDEEYKTFRGSYIIEKEDGKRFFTDVHCESNYRLVDIEEEKELKFKVGDVIEHKRIHVKYKVVKLAKEGDIVKGLWRGQDEASARKMYRKSYILENEVGEWCSLNVLSESEYELVNVEEKELKFKVGDIVQSKYVMEEQKVVKIAKKGERVEGPWASMRAYRDMSEKAYILEFIEGVSEGMWFYAPVTEEGTHELVEKTEEQLKFKAGDTIQSVYDSEEKYKVVKLAKKGDVVKGPWISGNEEHKLFGDSYILEDGSGKWFLIDTYLENSYRWSAVAEKEPEKTMNEEEVQKVLQRGIENCCLKLKDVKTPEDRQYYYGKVDSLQELYFNFFGRYFH